MLEQATALNIVLLPDEQTSNLTRVLSRQLATRFNTEFRLDEEHLPHITVYQGYYPDRNLPQLKNGLLAFAAQQRFIEVSMRGFQIWGNTIVFWNCDRTPHLQTLHDGTLVIANPLREGLVPPNAAILTGLSNEDKDNLAKTGGVLNGPKYHPHVTISKLKDPNHGLNALGVIEGMSPQTMSFTADRLYLSTLSDHGTVSAIIEEFKFGEV